MLIIGLGNADRGDDAAGLVAAEQLKTLGFDAIAHQGSPLDLLELWISAAHVIIIDAVKSGSPGGTIHIWELPKTPLRAEWLRSSMHNFGLAEAIELAIVLKRAPQRLAVYGIEGIQFDFGAPLSQTVLSGVEKAVGLIASLSSLSDSDTYK